MAVVEEHLHHKVLKEEIKDPEHKSLYLPERMKKTKTLLTIRMNNSRAPLVIRL
jgi:hypothetical protein